MSLKLVSLLFLLVGLQSFGQQSAETEMRPDEIIVRLVNGRNGKRVEQEVARIWQGDAKSASNLLADKGEVAAKFDRGEPRGLLVTPNFLVGCRFKGHSREGRLMRYSVDETVSKVPLGRRKQKAPHTGTEECGCICCPLGPDSDRGCSCACGGGARQRQQPTVFRRFALAC